MKTDEEYLKEAQEDIKKEIKNIHKGSNFDDFLKEEGIFEDAVEKAAKIVATELEISRKKIKTMTTKQVAEWLIEKHDEFVNTLDVLFSCMSMDPQDFNDRCIKIMYINELNTLLYTHEIEEITEEMIEVMKEKSCVDLLQILHVLGFI